jgi:hypothetical protein
MRLAEAIRQPALLRSEAVLLPALPTENARAALSQVRSKDKNIRVDDESSRSVEPAMATNIRAGRQVQMMNATGSMAGRAILQQVGAPYGNAVPNIRQNVRFPGAMNAGSMQSRVSVPVTAKAGTDTVKT